MSLNYRDFMGECDSKYYAFISYKSDDVKWAKWLQKRLERYSLPVRLRQKHQLPKRLSPVFRDGSDIRPGELKSELADNLRQSRYLIVLCSPKSAASEWVGEEIEQFCQMGRRDKIVALIIDGMPYSNEPSTECYHPVLRKWFPKGESVNDDRQLLGADIHSAGPESRYFKRERAFMQVLSAILQISYDELWNRRKRQLILQYVVYALLAVAFVAAVTLTWMGGKPFDVKVRLNETTVHNSELPFQDGTMCILSGNDTLGIRQVSAIDDEIIFMNIPGKFKGKETRIVFSMFGYESTDTAVDLSDSHVVDIARDGTFGVFAGCVVDEDGVPLEGVAVTIDGYAVVTDDHGMFDIALPVEVQSQQKHVVLTKDGYEPMDYDLQPQKDHNLVIFKR